MNKVMLGVNFKQTYVEQIPRFAKILEDGLEFQGIPQPVTIVPVDEEFESEFPNMIAVGDVNDYPLYIVLTTEYEIRRSIVGEEDCEAFRWTIWEPVMDMGDRETPPDWDYTDWREFDNWQDMIKFTILYQSIKRIENYMEACETQSINYMATLMDNMKVSED